MTAKTDKKARKRKSSLFLTLKGLFFRTEGEIPPRGGADAEPLPDHS